MQIKQMYKNYHSYFHSHFFVCIGLLTCSATYASSDPGCDAKIKLQDYGPNTVSIRKDDHDEANIDFTLSQMIPMFHDGCKGNLSNKDWYVRPYFAFNGQFGFYALDDRDSKPVLGKRFNPKFFLRHWIGDEGEKGYIDVGYAHESNGQSINNEQAYLLKRDEFIQKGERATFANDYLSRGWDYIDINYKKKTRDDPFYVSDVYVNLKYFLDDGLFQGEPEEYYSWETSNGKSRDQVDGISVLVKSSNIRATKKYGLKAALLLTTGYQDIFQYNTAKIEITYKIKDWPPIQFWAASGYNSDLTDYYKYINSIGVGFEMRNFLKDI